MGTHQPQPELFSYQVDLEKRVHAQHPLRRVLAMIDFTFAREVVAHTYGDNGRVSVDPAVLLELMFLLFQENVRSERDLMRRLPESFDWLWFLGYGLDDAIPDHSVLSKARKRWGGGLFGTLFVRTVRQCVEAGLVDSRKVHLDGSLIDADASRDSVVKADASTIARIKAAYVAQERKLDDTTRLRPARTSIVVWSAPPIPTPLASPKVLPAARPSPSTKYTAWSTTAAASSPPPRPPPATLPSPARRFPSSRSMRTTPAARSWPRSRIAIRHGRELLRSGRTRHPPPHQPAAAGRPPQRWPLHQDEFLYDAANDRYLCPAGQPLRPRRFHERRQMTDYVADKKTCAACPLRENCTAGRVGRPIARHWKEETLEFARAIARLPEAYTDRARRRHLMEGSFARSVNLHHFKRARWRRHWRRQIQDHLIAAVQNIAILAGAVSSGEGARLPRRPTAGRGTGVAALVREFRALRHRGIWLYAPLADGTGACLAA